MAQNITFLLFTCKKCLDVQEGKIRVNGVKTKDGVAININSSNYLNTVLGHEVTHFLEGTGVHYEALQKAAFKYAQTKGDYEGRRKTLEALYKNIEGTTVDYELTADLVGDYLFTEYDFIKSLSTENRNLFQKVYDQIKHMFRLATAGSKEARELEKVMHNFEKALRESTEIKNTITEDGVQYALANLKKVTPSKEKINSNVQEVAQMSPVHTVDEGKLLVSGKDFKEVYGEYFAEWGENIHSEEFGDIAAKSSSIRSEIRHGSTTAKIAAIEAIPRVIKNGKIVDWIEKNPGSYRIIVAAPISIGETPYIMGVMLQRDSQYQRLYIHDVVIEKETSSLAQDDLNATGSHAESDSLFLTSILQKIISVKNNLYDKKITEAPVTMASNESPQRTQDASAKQSVSQDTESVNTQKHKQSQFEVIEETNPMWDDYHTGIRSVNDIRTWEEVLALNDEREGQFVWGDFSREDAEQALKDNSITVYSSHPIENGAFVSTSYIQAREYAGGKSNSKVYSKTVPLNDVAWINGDEGQFARTVSESTQEGKGTIDKTQLSLSAGGKNKYSLTKDIENFDNIGNQLIDPDIHFSLSLKNIDIYSKEEYNNFGWARDTEAISKNELDDMYSKIHIKGSLKKFPQSGYGEAIIEVNDKPHTTLEANNVIAFVTGTKINPKITRVVRFNFFEEDLLDGFRKDIYEHNTKREIEAYARALGEEFIQYYDRSNSADYGEYTDKARTQRSGSKSEGNSYENRAGYQRNGTSETDIAPTKEASSTDGVFFDGENTKLSLSLEGEQRKLGGSYRFDGKDFGVNADEDIGPVKESLSYSEENSSANGTPLKDLYFDEDIGPVAETANSQTSVDINTQLSMDDIRTVKETSSTNEKTGDDTAHAEQTVDEKISAKLQNLKAEIENNKKLRDESNADFDSEIARLQAEYNEKKNKNTKLANNLLRRIERTQRLKANIASDYESRSICT